MTKPLGAKIVVIIHSNIHHADIYGTEPNLFCLILNPSHANKAVKNK